MKASRCYPGVPRVIALILLFAYLLFLLDLTWLQFPSRSPGHNVVPFRSVVNDWQEGGRELVVNFAGNIVAFLPIGLIPAAIRPRSARLWHAVLFCLTLSSLIEVVQYATGRRVADVDDVLLNTLGGALGYLLFWWPFAIGRDPAREGGPVEGLAAASDGPS